MLKAMIDEIVDLLHDLRNKLDVMHLGEIVGDDAKNSTDSRGEIQVDEGGSSCYIILGENGEQFNNEVIQELLAGDNPLIMC